MYDLQFNCKSFVTPVATQIKSLKVQIAFYTCLISLRKLEMIAKQPKLKKLIACKPLQASTDWFGKDDMAEQWNENYCHT